MKQSSAQRESPLGKWGRTDPWPGSRTHLKAISFLPAVLRRRTSCHLTPSQRVQGFPQAPGDLSVLPSPSPHPQSLFHFLSRCQAWALPLDSAQSSASSPTHTLQPAQGLPDLPAPSTSKGTLSHQKCVPAPGGGATDAAASVCWLRGPDPTPRARTPHSQDRAHQTSWHKAQASGLKSQLSLTLRSSLPISLQKACFLICKLKAIMASRRGQ